MIREKRGKLLAKYMVGRYRLGHEKVALYLACVLFESIINNKLGWNDDQLENTTLFNKIRMLCNDNLQDSLYSRPDIFKTYFANIKGDPTVCQFSIIPEERLSQIKVRLDNFRWFRNQIMHGKIDQIRDEGDNKKEDLINYIWGELDPDSFETAYTHRESGQSPLNSLYEHTADYMVRAIDEIEVKSKDKSLKFPISGPRIDRKDFENLFELRRKMAHFKNYLDEWLPKNANFLHTDILTTIDTTSGYIWMPLVSSKNIGIQSGIYGCSVSILATPLDLRIYMDFGGRAVRERKIYYDFLCNSDDYNALAEKFRVKNCLEVFDVDWYCAITRKLPFPKWLEVKGRWLEEAQNKLSGLIEGSRDPITWNRVLHGFIFSKVDLPESGHIDFPMLEPQLVDIIALFQSYSAYRLEVERKERKNAKRQKNSK